MPCSCRSASLATRETRNQNGPMNFMSRPICEHLPGNLRLVGAVGTRMRFEDLTRLLGNADAEINEIVGHVAHRSTALEKKSPEQPAGHSGRTHRAKGNARGRSSCGHQREAHSDRVRWMCEHLNFPKGMDRGATRGHLENARARAGLEAYCIHAGRTRCPEKARRSTRSQTRARNRFDLSKLFGSAISHHLEPSDAAFSVGWQEPGHMEVQWVWLHGRARTHRLRASRIVAAVSGETPSAKAKPKDNDPSWRRVIWPPMSGFRGMLCGPLRGVIDERA